MKKVAIFFVLLLTVLPISAQEVDEVSKKFGFMLVGRFSADNYDILKLNSSVRVIFDPALRRHDLLISIEEDQSVHSSHFDYIRIREQDWDLFETQMAIVYKKFKKWSQVAAMNNDKNFMKTIASFENVGRYRVSRSFPSDIHYSAINLHAIFRVNDVGSCYLILSSSGNPKRHDYPFMLSFCDETFHNLYELIKKENAMRNLDLVLKAIEQEELQEQAHDALYD